MKYGDSKYIFVFILGLTASLINSNCKPHNVEIEINTLETSMGSTIATIDNMESVLG